MRLLIKTCPATQPVILELSWEADNMYRTVKAFPDILCLRRSATPDAAVLPERDPEHLPHDPGPGTPIGRQARQETGWRISCSCAKASSGAVFSAFSWLRKLSILS